MRRAQSGQVMVLVAVSLLALIGSAALVLLAGSVEWQKNQLQQLADQAALDSALKIGTGCDATKAAAVITEADDFLGTQRTRIGPVPITGLTGASCTAPYTGTRTFAGGLSATYHYPYLGHQQQVEVIVTLTLPIAFGAEVGQTSTSVVRRAVAQQLAGSVPALSATTLSCTGGQVNVAGSVTTQNTVALSGSCAIYAHTRFDAASATYSDLGNVSVYTDGQTWTGTCVANANLGSTNAVCADGFELSGHTTPACGPAGTSNLSPGAKLINPNPCAAGTGPQPVAPLSTSLPPEPNTDPVAIATLQGTGGAACAAGTTYSPIIVNGVTVGTGLGPAPGVDASGYYHFKPSCYGYLNIAALTAGISKVQVGPVVTAKHFITPTFPVPTTAGTLLVASLRSDASPTRFIPPAGWLPAGAPSQSGTSPRTEIWYYPNNPGAVPNPLFTITPATIDSTAQVSEWRNVATVLPLDQTGNFSTGTSQLTATVTTGGATSVANELVITNDGVIEGTVGQALTTPAGWNSLANDPTDGFSSEYRLDLPAAVAGETVTASVATTWALVIATFKPGAGGGGAPAVFDPGFYHFNGWNGSNFTSGGGICLNGGTLLARDVTLEFVNQAGFSTGTCAVGGGAACAGACQFGSPPCSLQPCPPNAGADSPNNLTWFAAPCSTAPAGDAASCPGSSWCLPPGDRSCSNVLIWAAASNTGQIAIVGVAAKHWLLGSVYWPGTCTDTVNGTSTIAGTLFCGNLTISAGAGAAIAVGGDYGIATSLAEAVLVE
jgi:hypothetical protein